jgi:molybdopterin-guanine dinucleotide biosynthesis protein B
MPTLNVANFPIPLLGICAACSGMGKTTLITQLIPALAKRGCRVSVIKHTHHAFEIDRPGKDSYLMRQSGAVQTMIGSAQRWALMTELAETAPDQPAPQFADLLRYIDSTLVDMVLVEGFKETPIPKIEVHRAALNQPILAKRDAHIIAVASDAKIDAKIGVAIPTLDLNAPETIADFIVQTLKPRHHTSYSQHHA